MSDRRLRFIIPWAQYNPGFIIEPMSQTQYDWFIQNKICEPVATQDPGPQVNNRNAEPVSRRTTTKKKKKRTRKK